MKDENFAVDLLTYEREYLSRVFLNVVEGLRNEDLRECCKRIYETYE